MIHIYQKLEVWDTVIQQLFSTSVPSPLPMMEYEVAGVILKPDGHKEGDADPPVALWGLWFYRSFKVDRVMVHPLAAELEIPLGYLLEV